MIRVFFNDTATTEIYTLSLHDALPICPGRRGRQKTPASAATNPGCWGGPRPRCSRTAARRSWLPRTGEWRRWHEQRGKVSQDRKSTRLNSSHANISYAVFCLKKKKQAP